MLRMLDTGITRFASFLGWLAFAAMFVMAVHISASVVLRYVSGRDIPVTIEVAQYYYMVALTYLPLTLIEKNNRHLNAEFLYTLFPAWLRRTLDFSTQILLALYVGFLAWRSYLNAVDRSSVGETISTTIGDFPIWPARWLVPISLAVVVAFIIIRLLRPYMGDDQSDTTTAIER